MNSSDCEPLDFYSESIHTAKRKPGMCCECRKPINIGERYASCRMKFDGRMGCYAQHVRCYHFARHINMDLHDECVVQFYGLDEEDWSEWNGYENGEGEMWKRIKDGFEFTPPPGSKSEKHWQDMEAIRNRKAAK